MLRVVENSSVQHCKYKVLSIQCTEPKLQCILRLLCVAEMFTFIQVRHDYSVHIFCYGYLRGGSFNIIILWYHIYGYAHICGNIHLCIKIKHGLSHIPTAHPSNTYPNKTTRPCSITENTTVEINSTFCCRYYSIFAVQFYSRCYCCHLQ